MTRSSWWSLAAAVIASCTPVDGPREICGNGLDDDGNGQADCADRDCAGQAACYAGTCARCGIACAKQTDCIAESYARDRPLPVCDKAVCKALNQPISVRVEYDTKNSWGGLGLSPQSVLTRFIKKTAVDGSAVTCATVAAVATGCKQADALQLEDKGTFVLQGWDLYKLSNPMLGQGISLPFVNVGTGSDYLIYTEFWAGPPVATSDRPQNNRLGWGCFDADALTAAVVASDNCPSTTSDAGTCRVFRLVMPGPMAAGCP